MRYRLASLRFLLVVLLGLVTACSAEGAIENIFNPCSPLTIATADDIEQHELQSIEEAIAAWDRVLPTQISVGGPAEGGGLSVLFDSGETFFRAIYFDKRGEIVISREKLAPEDFSLALAHELGHAFGLWHVPAQERESVMNVGNLDIAPSADDALLVSALWESCGESR